ncbi:MAG: hypothetical protein RSB47_00500 [Ruthenibacterium sp.]
MKKIIIGILALLILALTLSFAACGKTSATSAAASTAPSVSAPVQKTTTGLVTQNEKGTFTVETGLAAVTFSVKDGEVPAEAAVDARVEITYVEGTKDAAAKLVSVRVLEAESTGKVQPMNPGPVVTANVTGTVVDATMSTVTIDADGAEIQFAFADSEPEINCPVRIGMKISITYEGKIGADSSTADCTVVRIDAAEKTDASAAQSAGSAASKAK